jgi:ABC-type glycerol-3-phosphate transport system permease component
MTNAERRRHTRRSILFVLLLAIVLMVNLPVIVMVANSFQTTDQILASRSLIPHHFTFANFIFLSGRTPYWTFFANSILVGGAATAIGVVAAALAGYALSRYQRLALSVYSGGLLLVQMFPIIVALIPLFVLFRNLGLINSPVSVILVYAVVHMPFATWMCRAYFDTIPRELEEAAQVDGCTRLQALRLILLPLAAPGIAAVVIFSILFSFNEFFVASVFLRDESVMTIPVGIQMFMQQYATDWGSLMAAATVTAVPAFLFLLFVQRHIAHGAMAGAVKG